MANEAYLQKQITTEDERRYELDKLNPETEAGRLIEAERQRELDRQKELYDSRWGSGGQRDTSAMQNTKYYESLSPELREIYDHVNKASPQGVMTQEDKSQFVADAIDRFSGLSRREKEDELLRNGIDPDTPRDQIDDLLIQAYWNKINIIEQQGQQQDSQQQTPVQQEPAPLMGPTGQPEQTPNINNIPPPAIELLRNSSKDPEMKDQFDAIKAQFDMKYGYGAADAILNG